MGGHVNARVLVVEDDEPLRFGMVATLRAQGFDVIEAASCRRADEVVARDRPDVVVTDLRLPDGEAIDLLRSVRKVDPSILVYIVTGYGTIDVAVRALKEGAEDFLTKPVEMQTLIQFVRDATTRRRAERPGVRSTRPEREVFRSRSGRMQQVEQQVERLRDADCSVLIVGETGTGKSVLARRLHAVGARARGPLVDVNCASLSREFVESELFGHERGAFTGAHGAKQGLFDAAHGGTLFLDEIGDIDLQVQPKILKVLEERRFRRMGDVRERTADVRLFAATHHDLLEAVKNKTFRADLYYRISTVTLTMPALRDRPEDIVPLAYQMLGETTVELSRDAEASLLDYPWPGNIRELKNVIERALVLRLGHTIRASDLCFDASLPRVVAAAPVAAAPAPVAPMPAPAATSGITPVVRDTQGAPFAQVSTLEAMEREHIRMALAAENGRVEAAARRLGISRSTLYQRIKNYGLLPSRHRLAPTGTEPSE